MQQQEYFIAVRLDRYIAIFRRAYLRSSNTDNRPHSISVVVANLLREINKYQHSIRDIIGLPQFAQHNIGNEDDQSLDDQAFDQSDTFEVFTIHQRRHTEHRQHEQINAVSPDIIAKDIK